MILDFDDTPLQTYEITVNENEIKLLLEEHRKNVEWYDTGKERNYGLLKEELADLRGRINNVFHSNNGEYYVSTSLGSPSDAYKYFYICEPKQISPLFIDENTKNPFSNLKEQLDILGVWTAEEVLIVLTNSDKIMSDISASQSFKIILTKRIYFLPENRFIVMMDKGRVVALIPYYKFNVNMDKTIFRNITETLNKYSEKFQDTNLLDIVITTENVIRVLSYSPNIVLHFKPFEFFKEVKEYRY